MKTIIKLAALLSFLAVHSVNAAHTDVAGGMDMVHVGNSGNTADTTGNGSVDYDYSIGKYEVTNAQYAAFLNDAAKSDAAGLYNPLMGTSQYGGIIRSGTDGNYTYAAKAGKENNAVNYVSLYDAAYFCNWLTSGDIYTGVYIITGSGSTGNITRDAGWNWYQGGFVLPTEDEWYKAAYYNPATDTYYKYATSSDTISGSDANYSGSGNGNTVINVDFGAESPYGTYGQSGNVWEWDETIIISDRQEDHYGVRGGGFLNGPDGLESSQGSYYPPNDEASGIGFRVGSLSPIPEPSAYSCIAGMAILVFASAVQKRRRI